MGVDDPLTGQAVAVFVVPARRPEPDEPKAWRAMADAVRTVLVAHVALTIGPVAKPTHVVLVPDLPKTRSGKIMRRLLGDLLVGRSLGDTTSLQDETVVPSIQAVVHGPPDPAAGSLTGG